jgi:hypothetical protein
VLSSCFFFRVPGTLDLAISAKESSMIDDSDVDLIEGSSILGVSSMETSSMISLVLSMVVGSWLLLIGDSVSFRR